MVVQHVIPLYMRRHQLSRPPGRANILLRRLTSKRYAVTAKN